MAKNVVGIRFRKSGRMYYFDPLDFEIHLTDGVIVETAQGVEFADVVMEPRELPDEQIIAPLKPILRVATKEDHEIHQRNLELEQEAFSICQEKVTQHALDMKLVDVEYSFGGSKITFFFTSDGRVDFRDLVKDLAFVFKTRIELRQIGVRDEAKMLGGLGSCGRPVCCKTFLADFQPVSIKMAKEQKLSLSPTKISGLCGRLMCCLKYEQDAYESMRKLMPKVGKEVITPEGKGTVLDNNAITERTKVRLMLLDGTMDIREYHFSQVRKPVSPEEDVIIQKELAKAAKARSEAEVPAEDEFRFVTGATREEVPPRPSTPRAERPEGRQNSRRPRTEGARASRQGDDAGGNAPRRQPQGTKPKQNPPRRQGEQAQKQPRPQQNASAAAPAEAAAQSNSSSRRRRRGGRRNKKPGAPSSGNATPPAAE